MSIRALNQNFPSLNFAANAEEQGPSHPSLSPHGEGDQPYPNPWSFQSGNGQAGRPGHPYKFPWAQAGDEDKGNEPNNETGNTSASRKPYPYPGPAEGHPLYTFPGASESCKPYPFPGYAQQPRTYPGPLPWHQPHAYRSLAEGRKPYPSLWDEDKPNPSPRKPYPYPGPGDGPKPHSYPGAVPWRQPYQSPWEDDDKSKPSFPRQPHQFPGGSHSAGPFPQQPYKYPGNPHGATPFPQQPYPFPRGQPGGHGKAGWGGHSSFGQPNFGGPSVGGFGRGGFEAPYASHSPWVFSQQAPYTFPSTSTGSDKYKPKVDVFDTPETFVIHVPLPGAKKEDIEVNWDPRTVELSINGVLSRPGSEDLVKTITLDERKVGAFERKVRLGSRANPPKVDGDAISAKLEDGVLVVDVPKTEPDEVEVKKVEVD
ncbi:HSP20-like chaperone [Aspergillus alliaceus]|uniref:HSP20-like chaperone n=1 Tax=Petromyces alliaceus TaxID=209559 RepID=A0A5N7BR27_PETAA|nr:HSP20-like chaperone [Aspergillus alliaceus]